jgi:hypothetical protein
MSSNIGDLLDKSTGRMLSQQISNRSNLRRLLLTLGEAQPNIGPAWCATGPGIALNHQHCEPNRPTAKPS